MMKLHINLLSPEKKRNLTVLTRYLFAKELLELMIFTLSLLAMMYIFAWFIIAGAMTDAVTSSLLVNREAPLVNKDIQKLNRLTKNIIISAEDFMPFTPKILEIAAALPPNIKLIGLDINRVNNTISLSGTAATRAALLNFQKVIRDIGWINGITAPNSQLFQKENINFEIRGNLVGLPTLK